MSRMYYLVSDVMHFRDMNEVIKCTCMYTVTLLYSHIQLTGIMLIYEGNSFNYFDIRKMNKNGNES